MPNLFMLKILFMRTLNIKSRTYAYAQTVYRTGRPDVDTSSTVHEQSERREASKMARMREGPRHAFERVVEREASFVERPEFCYRHCLTGG